MGIIYDNISVSHTLTYGDFHNLSCTYFIVSPVQDAWYLPDIPRGSRDNPNSYAVNCGDTPALSEVIAIGIYIGIGGTYDSIFTFYDPEGRIVAIQSPSDTGLTYVALAAWIGRFGENDEGLEIYKPGRYVVTLEIVGNGTAAMEFNLYSQTDDKYIIPQTGAGNDSYNGNSWGYAKKTWLNAQTALTAGSTLHVLQEDYSAEDVTFDKSMSIAPYALSGGLTVPAFYDAGSPFGNYTYINCANPFLMDGTINKWSLYSWNGFTAKCKIYRGGNPGSFNAATTSTLIWESDVETMYGYHDTLNIFDIDPPVSVQRGDCVAVYSPNALYFRNITYDYSGTSCGVAGDVGNATFDTTYPGYEYAGMEIMVRAYNAPAEVVLPTKSCNFTSIVVDQSYTGGGSTGDYYGCNPSGPFTYYNELCIGGARGENFLPTSSCLSRITLKLKRVSGVDLDVYVEIQDKGYTGEYATPYYAPQTGHDICHATVSYAGISTSFFTEVDFVFETSLPDLEEKWIIVCVDNYDGSSTNSDILYYVDMAVSVGSYTEHWAGKWGTCSWYTNGNAKLWFKTWKPA